MRVVSRELIRALIEVAERDGISVEDLLYGSGIAEGWEVAKNKRSGWSVLRRVLSNLTAFGGGDPEHLATVGARLLTTDALSRQARLLGISMNFPEMFKQSRLWLAPSLLPFIRRNLTISPDGGAVSLELEQSESMTFLEDVFWLEAGLHAGLPALVGSEPVTMDVEVSGRTALLEYQLPSWVRERSETEIQRDLVATVFSELTSQQLEVQQGFERQRRAAIILNSRTRRLESFQTIGQRIAQQIELQGLVESVLKLLLVDFGCQGGLIELGVADGQRVRWGMGVREGAATISYEIGIHGEVPGCLELWEPSWPVTEEGDDPVATLMPWLAVAFDNALAFHRLEEEKRLSEERARTIERTRKSIAEREYQYRVLVEEATDAIAVIGLDGLMFLEVNRSMCNTLGHERDEMLDMSYRDILYAPDSLDSVRFRNALRSGEVIREFHRYASADGELIEVEVVAKRLADDRAQIVARDMTRWQKTQERLRESEERYALAVRGANDGLWDWDLRSGDVYYSPRWKRMLGFHEDDLGTSPEEWFGRVHHEDLPQLQRAIRAHIEGDADNFEVEHRMRNQEGSWRWMLTRGLVVRAEDGSAYRMAGSQTDMTDRKRAEEQLYHDAFHDSLTGLRNRAYFLDELKRMIGGEAAFGDGFAVLYIDLDRFKVINDSLGHALGDRLLVAIAQRLREAVGYNELVARLGGDEFTVLVQNVVDHDVVVRVAERVLAALERPFVVQGRELHLSSSIGLAFSDLRTYTEPEEVIRDADMAMYHAKSRGKSRFEIFDETLHHKAVTRMQLEIDLRQAIEQEAIHLYYQPLVAVGSDDLVGFEALARWNHPEKGMISPGSFIPMAEESGMIHALGGLVISQAARQWRAWEGKLSNGRTFSISVNVSPRQFRRGDIVDEIIERVEKEQLPEGAISLEITESALIEDSDTSITKIRRLREAGFRVVIDDFGVGYSSFNYLVRLPVNAIKIDRSFVFGMESDETKHKVVAAIVNLARSIGVDIVAEGVETAEQYGLLNKLSQDLNIQGAYFSMPVPPEEAVEFFREDWWGPV